MSEPTFKGKAFSQLTPEQAKEAMTILAPALNKLANQIQEQVGTAMVVVSKAFNRLADQAQYAAELLYDSIEEVAEERGQTMDEFLADLRAEIKKEREAEVAAIDKQWQESLASLKAMKASKKRVFG